jgi:hypothetical protein
VATGLGQVPIYARGASGAAAPLRVIAGPATGLRFVTAVAIDTANDVVVVADGDSIKRFALSFTDGNEAPLTTIHGAATGLASSQSVFVDNVNGEIFVLDGNVKVFRLTDDGNVAPLRTPDIPITVTDLIVDPFTSELFAATAGGAQIEVYPRTATGPAQSSRAIVTYGVLRSPITGLAFCN